MATVSAHQAPARLAELASVMTPGSDLMELPAFANRSISRKVTIA